MSRDTHRSPLLSQVVGEKGGGGGALCVSREGNPMAPSLSGGALSPSLWRVCVSPSLIPSSFFLSLSLCVCVCVCARARARVLCLCACVRVRVTTRRDSSPGWWARGGGDGGAWARGRGSAGGVWIWKVGKEGAAAPSLYFFLFLCVCVCARARVYGRSGRRPAGSRGTWPRGGRNCPCTHPVFRTGVSGLFW